MIQLFFDLFGYLSGIYSLGWIDSTNKRGGVTGVTHFRVKIYLYI